MAFLDNPTSKQIDFLDRYAKREPYFDIDFDHKYPCEYHLKLGGISYDFTLHVEGQNRWITGSFEDLELLKGIAEEAG